MQDLKGLAERGGGAHSVDEILAENVNSPSVWIKELGVFVIDGGGAAVIAALGVKSGAAIVAAAAGAIFTVAGSTVFKAAGVFFFAGADTLVVAGSVTGEGVGIAILFFFNGIAVAKMVFDILVGEEVFISKVALTITGKFVPVSFAVGKVGDGVNNLLVKRLGEESPEDAGGANEALGKKF